LWRPLGKKFAPLKSGPAKTTNDTDDQNHTPGHKTYLSITHKPDTRNFDISTTGSKQKKTNRYLQVAPAAVSRVNIVTVTSYI